MTLVAVTLPVAALEYLEAQLRAGTYEYKVEFARRHFSRGEASGEARALLEVLSARGIEVSDDARNRITECADPEQLQVWVRRAATASSIHDVLD